ncbi:MAG: right-handed parallel beta-helix repeat-containing protein [Chitinophagales bacterium]|nr:right-handed parallel beta-helix repeat-containing protein [Chitinophagales bacterium]MDW8419667.1 right-handed parallel beta-helix repeat-containing protein [Chitinophagales bacterium]
MKQTKPPSKIFAAAAFALVFTLPASAQQPTVQLFPSYHSIGYRIKLPASFDADTNATAFVRYYSANHPLDTGFAPYRFRQDTFNELRGSLFMLQPNTKYHLQITLTDSTPALQTFTFNDSVTTRAEPAVQPTGNVKYVSPTGSGNAYTLANPGNLATLINNNLVTCGTTVLLLDGVYDVSNLNLNITSDCTPQTPIVIMAAPGANPVMDGGFHQPLVWTQDPFDSTLYSAPNQTAFNYTSLCIMGNERLYPYAILSPNGSFPNYPSLLNLGYGHSGFYRDKNSIWIKTAEGKNPNFHSVILSKSINCLTVEGNNKQCYLRIKGITFRYYSKPNLLSDFWGNYTGSYLPQTLYFKDVNHVLIDSCRFEYSNFPVSFYGNCNYNTIINCVIRDGTGLWGHGAFKATRDEFYLVQSSFGRGLENCGIYFKPSPGATLTGNVIFNNQIHGVVAGIAAGNVDVNAVMQETDIYNNTIDNCYDGIDGLNGQVNLRIWHNDIARGPVGLSFIGGRFGPRYVFRNVVHHTSHRKNVNDITFVHCNNTMSDKIWGTGIKMNAGGTTPNPGALFLMHNTFHAADTLAFAMYLWQTDWRKLYSRNNIYYNEGMSTFFFDNVANNPTYSFNSHFDNYFSGSSGAVAIVQPVNGQPVCHTYFSPAQLDTGLRNITMGGDVEVKFARHAHPQFVATDSNFRLQCTSPMIDNGTILHGINNRSFYGLKPDIGAYEFMKTIVSTVINDTIVQTDTLPHFTFLGNTTASYT